MAQARSSSIAQATGPADAGTTWADVGLAIVDFARQEPGVFISVVAVLILFTLVAALCIWLMLPRATAALARLYDAAREEARESNRDLFSNGD